MNLIYEQSKFQLYSWSKLQNTSFCIVFSAKSKKAIEISVWECWKPYAADVKANKRRRDGIRSLISMGMAQYYKKRLDTQGKVNESGLN